MILDLQTQFSGSVSATGVKTAQAITATAISTNVLDLKQAPSPALQDEGIIGRGDTWLIVQVVQAFNTLTSLTTTFESATDAALSSGPVVHITTGAILLAALTANAFILQNQLPSQFNYKRYCGLRYTVGGSNPTQGSVLAFFSKGPSRPAIYPSGYSVDA